LSGNVSDVITDNIFINLSVARLISQLPFPGLAFNLLFLEAKHLANAHRRKLLQLLSASTSAYLLPFKNQATGKPAAVKSVSFPPVSSAVPDIPGLHFV